MEKRSARTRTWRRVRGELFAMKDGTRGGPMGRRLVGYVVLDLM